MILGVDMITTYSILLSTYIGHVLGRYSKNVGTNPCQGTQNGKTNPNPSSRFQIIDTKHLDDNIVQDNGNQKQDNTQHHDTTLRTGI